MHVSGSQSRLTLASGARVTTMQTWKNTINADAHPLEIAILDVACYSCMWRKLLCKCDHCIYVTCKLSATTVLHRSRIKYQSANVLLFVLAYSRFNVIREYETRSHAFHVH